MTGAPTLTACSSSDAEQSAARALRRPGPLSSDTAVSPLRDLVRQAILAPSSHNKQCWRFRIAEKSISIAPDLARRCPVVDPDDHHVFVSPGCAAENMVHAALAIGLHADPRFEPGGDGAIGVSLEATQKRISPLFSAIAERQCTRGLRWRTDFTGRIAPTSGALRAWPRHAAVDAPASAGGAGLKARNTN